MMRKMKTCLRAKVKTYLSSRVLSVSSSSGSSRGGGGGGDEQDGVAHSLLPEMQVNFIFS